jgi:hypothetical protein
MKVRLCKVNWSHPRVEEDFLDMMLNNNLYLQEECRYNKG